MRILILILFLSSALEAQAGSRVERRGSCRLLQFTECHDVQVNFWSDMSQTLGAKGSITLLHDSRVSMTIHYPSGFEAIMNGSYQEGLYFIDLHDFSAYGEHIVETRIVSASLDTVIVTNIMNWILHHNHGVVSSMFADIPQGPVSAQQAVIEGKCIFRRSRPLNPTDAVHLIGAQRR